jgi:HK97 family phage portal protein
MWIPSWLARKAKDTTKYLTATIAAHDRGGYRRRKPDVMAMVQRDIGYIAICSAINAASLASCPIRLYTSKRAKLQTRKLTQRERKWIYDTEPMHGIGAKAADMVDEAGDVERVMSHPLLDFIADPNPDDRGFSYWELHFALLELCGNAFHHVVTTGPKQVFLFPLFPQFMQIQPGTDQLVSHYVYSRDTSNEQRFERDEVLHAVFRKRKSDPFWGSSWTYDIYPEHDLRSAMNQHATNLFKNGASPDLAISFKNKVTEQEIARVRDEVEAKYSGLQNVGRTLMMGDATITKLGDTMRDLDYEAGRRKVESDIMAAAGVPESMLRLNDANLASSLSGDVTYSRRTILPRITKHVEWLNEVVVPLFGGGVFFIADNPVPDDKAARLDATRLDVAAGIITTNEARAVRGLDPIDDPLADSLLFSGQPLGFVAPSPFGPPQNDQRPTREPEEEPEDDQEPEEPAKSVASIFHPPATPSPVAKAAQLVSQRALWSGSDCGCSKSLRPVNLETSPAPNAMADAVFRVFAEQRDALLASMDVNPSGYKTASRVVKASDPAAEAARLLKLWGALDPTWQAKMEAAVGEFADDRFGAAAEAAINFVAQYAEGVPDDAFELGDEDAAAMVARYTAGRLDRLQGINDTTANALAGTIEEAVRAGENIQSMRMRVQAVYDAESAPGQTISRRRAETIARTETAKAQTSGNMAGWQASGVVEGKRWLVSLDACEFCEAAAREFNSRTVKLDEPFYRKGSTLRGTDGGVMALDFDDVDAAPLHPSCKCDVVPVIVGYGAAAPVQGALS